jgi:YNFM family putative membrane transporter
MNQVARRLAVGLAGFCAFLNLYSPQALLPSLANEFNIGATGISMTMTASTLAVALIAPFTGVVADVLGRKRVIVWSMVALIVPTVMLSIAPSVEWMIVGRFVQGLMLPPIFAVTIAYIGEEWSAAEAAGVTGLYTSGASLGGFTGRFITGTMSDLFGWRGAFLTIAAVTVVCAITVALMLPRERGFVRSENLSASMRQMLRHIRNPQLLATYVIGFGVLFNFIATFTYITFLLAAPPYSLSATMLGAIFVTYLTGVFLTPWVGRVVARFGRRHFVIGVIALWIGGILLTLLPSLAAIIAGLAICAGCGLLCQAVSTGYVTTSTSEGRSSAVGLYVTSFYIGGSFGALIPGFVYEAAGWPACATIVIAVLIAMGFVVTLLWEHKPAATA